MLNILLGILFLLGAGLFLIFLIYMFLVGYALIKEGKS